MVLIFGKGKTGLSVKNFLDNKNIQNILIDDNDSYNLNNIDYIVISPGVPFSHKIYREAKKRKIPVFTDIELGYKYFKGEIVAITGTDGKTTTTTIIYNILKSHFEKTYIGGNYGIPFTDILKETEKGIAVLELSSFQIYSIKDFRPNIAVFLNISTDHLDWHKKYKHYLLSKLKIFKNQKENDYAVLNFSYQFLRDLNIKSKKLFFSLTPLPEEYKGIYIKDNYFWIRAEDEIKLFPIEKVKLKGKHNLENVMAGLIVGYIKGVPIEKMEEVIQNFKPLEHRIEYVDTINGVDFYNDSKATTVQAVYRAVESFNNKIILILGGINKGGDFSALKDFKDKIKKVFIIGKSKEEIKDMIKDFADYSLEESLQDAVLKATEIAEKGDTILFSPGCASFDMFKNYADRGNRFKDIVKRVKEEKNETL